jgi:hypothetical protein
METLIEEGPELFFIPALPHQGPSCLFYTIAFAYSDDYAKEFKALGLSQKEHF